MNRKLASPRLDNKVLTRARVLPVVRVSPSDRRRRSHGPGEATVRHPRVFPVAVHSYTRSRPNYRIIISLYIIVLSVVCTNTRVRRVEENKFPPAAAENRSHARLPFNRLFYDKLGPYTRRQNATSDTHKSGRYRPVAS